MHSAHDVKRIFGQALEIATPSERAAYLDATCAGQPELRAEIDSLLAALDKAGSFLDRPAADAGVTVDAALVGESGTTVSGEHPGARLGPFKLLQQLGEG